MLTYQSHCDIPNCSGRVYSRSGLCNTHRRRFRRLGGPLQTAIRRHELKPWEDYIAKRQASHADSEAWTICRRLLQGLYDTALAAARGAYSGSAFWKVEADAGKRLSEVAAHSDPDRVIRACLSVLMHCRAQPGRYTADLVPVFAVARAVLRLAPASVGRYWNNTTRKVHSVRKETPPRVLMHIGRVFIESFGGAAVQLYALWEKQRSAADVEREKLAAAFAAMG